MFRRLLDALLEREPPKAKKPTQWLPKDAPESAYPPELRWPEPLAPEDRIPSMEVVPPEESGIPPGPYESLSPYEKVVHSEGFVDYDVWEQTGEFVITDETAGALIWAGWFDMTSSADDRRAAREEYFDYVGEEPRDFDWQTWKDWYDPQSAAAA